MKNYYNLLKQELTKNKRDITFYPEHLDGLTDEQRKEIEDLIFKEIKLGNQTCYKFAPYLKTIAFEREMEENENFSLPEYDVALIYGYLFSCSPSPYSLGIISNIAPKDYRIFSLLVNLYGELDVSHKYKEKLYSLVKYIYDQTDNKIIKEIFGKRMPKTDFKGTDEGFNKEINIYTSHPEFGNSEQQQQVFEQLKSSFSKLIPSDDEKKKLALNGALFGFIVGDAIGVPVEFSNRDYLVSHPVKDMMGYGTHSVPKGTWSDDSSMTLATMKSIGDMKRIDYDNIMQCFCDWYFKADYTATDRVFDIGGVTYMALKNYKNLGDALSCGQKSFRSNGNGSLMRMLPVSFYINSLNQPEEEDVRVVNNISSLTHAHEISQIGCYIYHRFINNLLNGKDKLEAYREVCNFDYSKYYSLDNIKPYERLLGGNIQDVKEDEISSSGFVVSTLEAAIWSILLTSNYEEAILKAVNLGNDTDTVAAITGSMAGLIYGYEAIPKKWIESIPKREYLDSITKSFTDVLITKDEYLNRGI